MVSFPSVLAIVSVVPGKMLMVTVALLLAAAESMLGATGPMVAVLGKVVSTAVTTRSSGRRRFEDHNGPHVSKPWGPLRGPLRRKKPAAETGSRFS